MRVKIVAICAWLILVGGLAMLAGNQSVQGGGGVVICTTDTPEGRWTDVKITFDPRLDYSITKMESIQNGKLKLDLICSEFAPSPKVQFPRKHVWTSYSDSGHIEDQETSVFTHVKINEPIDPSVFRREGIGMLIGTPIREPGSKITFFWDGKTAHAQERQDRPMETGLPSWTAAGVAATQSNFRLIFLR